MRQKNDELKEQLARLGKAFVASDDFNDRVMEKIRQSSAELPLSSKSVNHSGITHSEDIKGHREKPNQQWSWEDVAQCIEQLFLEDNKRSDDLFITKEETTFRSLIDVDP